MARNRSPRFKKCRSLGLNVYGHSKAMNRFKESDSREAKKLSAYGLQLLEKQRLKEYYGVLEKQFKIYVKEAFKSKEQTGEVLVSRLERRLDNMVYRLGFANSLRQARQMVSHGLILVDGSKVNRPSFSVGLNTVISLKKDQKVFKDNFTDNLSNTLPYIEKDKDSFSGKLTAMPKRDEVPIEIKDHLIIEYYSKLM
ncbi:MAG: 30S ribosomal protein S4 [Clostridia bacterium]|nr:30S ribosomal protein S4 [Clostridia bacterium]